MAKFINKKQQVMDFQLTPYGKYKLSIGRFRPVYYAFYDGEILYDSKYGQSGSAGFTASPEPQQNIHDRIKNNTSYISSLVCFEELENSVPPSPLIRETVGDVIERLNARAADSLDPMDADDVGAIEALLGGVATGDEGNELSYFSIDLGEKPRQDIPRPDIYRFGQPIGNSRFDGPTQQNVPAWKIAMLQGTISSSSPINLLHQEERVPQLNTKIIYKKRILDSQTMPDVVDPSSVSQVVSTTPRFTDRKVISLIRDNLLAYVEEVNTELLTENFDINVYKVEEVPPVDAIGEIFFGETCPVSGSKITINDGKKTYAFEFKNKDDPISTRSPRSVTRYDVAEDPKCTQCANNLRQAIVISPLNVQPSVRLNGEGTKNILTIINKRERTTHVYTNNAIVAEDTSGRFSVKGFVSGAAKTELLHPKKFTRVNPQIVNGFMQYATAPEVNMFGDNDPLTLTTSSVEYYFDILTDTQVDQKQACRGSHLFNKDSYYIDLDFECEDEEVCSDDERLFYDIYGASNAGAGAGPGGPGGQGSPAGGPDDVPEPDICEDD